MKRTIYITRILALLILAGCEDFLTEENKSNATAENLYVTRAGYESLINACYSTLRDVYRPVPYMFCAGTDMYYGDHQDSPLGLSTYLSLTPGEPRVGQFFQLLYSSIQVCNTALFYANKTEDYTALHSRIGEAQYLRAFYYFLLVQSFGDVSLVADMVSTPITHFERTPASEVYEFIIKELKSSIVKVPVTQSEFGRVTRRAAQNLLAKIYLTRGYEEYGVVTDFSDAAAYADSAINNLGLTVSYEDIFKYKNDRTDEIIFSVQFDGNSIVFGGPHSWDIPWGPLIGGFGTDSKKRFLRPTEYLFTLFEEYDLRFEATFGIIRTKEYSDWVLNPGKTQEIYYFPWTADQIANVAAWRAENPTNRAKTVVIPKGPDWWDKTKTIYPALKKLDRVHTTNVQYVHDVYLNRLGETYLIAAEAYYKAGDASTAADRLNVVRARAAAPGFEQAMVVGAGDVDIDLILDERARELAGEGHRWFDLKRTGKLMERTRLYNPEIRSIYDSGQDPFLGSNGHYKILRPIPLSAISLDSGDYPQNPAYE